jgi:hypothetical protein
MDYRHKRRCVADVATRVNIGNRLTAKCTNELVQRIRAVDLGTVLLGERGKGQYIGLGVIHQRGQLWHPRA